MITYEEAKKIILNELKGMEERSNKYLTPGETQLNLVIIENNTIEDDFGWVFFYDTKEHYIDGNLDYAMGGNAPIIITRKEGEIHRTGTAYDVKYYIEKFRKEYNEKL